MAVEEGNATTSGRGSAAGTAGSVEALAGTIAGDMAKADPALAARAAAVLDEQAEVLRLQKERLREEATSLREEQKLSLSHLRVRRFGDFSRMTLEILIGLVLLFVLVGLATMVIGATRDRDLVFDELNVPPDLVAHGVTGKVLSTKLLAEFGRIQVGTTSISQDAESFRSGSGGNIRIAIPNTGISISELDQYLRDLLGNETHISGEILHTPNGLSLTVRLGQTSGVTISGPEEALPSLLQRAAEALYALALPLRYADYLVQKGRDDEALTILKPLSQYGTTQQRAQALASWSELLYAQGDPRAALDLAQAAVHLAPNVLYTQWVLADVYLALGHEEQALGASNKLARIAQNMPATVAPDAAYGWLYYRALGLQLIGDHEGALSADDQLSVAQVNSNFDSLVMFDRVVSYAMAHDERGAHIALAALPDLLYYYPPHLGPLWSTVVIDTDREDWNAAVADSQKLMAIVAGKREYGPIMAGNFVGIEPMVSVALAHLGDFSRAEALIAPTPLDCDSCVRARGRIAALRHDWRNAEKWFAIVDERSPSIPTAAYDWGTMLMARGDLDSAIAKFADAHRKSPHFADPLEMWGEALMQKSRSDLALAKFEEADKYTPNWGRLHMKWGEALGYSGRKAEARAQYRVASTLDLSVADKAELARDMRR